MPEAVFNICDTEDVEGDMRLHDGVTEGSFNATDYTATTWAYYAVGYTCTVSQA